MSRRASSFVSLRVAAAALFAACIVFGGSTAPSPFAGSRNRTSEHLDVEAACPLREEWGH